MAKPNRPEKLIISELNKKLKQKTLRALFMKYGQIVDVILRKDPETNKLRKRCSNGAAFETPTGVKVRVRVQRMESSPTEKLEWSKGRPAEWNMSPKQHLGVADLDHLLLPDVLILPEVEEEEKAVIEEVGGFPHT